MDRMGRGSARGLEGSESLKSPFLEVGIRGIHLHTTVWGGAIVKRKSLLLTKKAAFTLKDGKFGNVKNLGPAGFPILGRPWGPFVKSLAFDKSPKKAQGTSRM